MGVGVVMKEGKITATTAEASGGKHVDCGFIPSYVKVWNANAVVTENAILERFFLMDPSQSLATVIIADDGSTSDVNIVNETSNGLNNFDEDAVSQVETTLTGSNFAKVKASTTLTGTGSAFLTEVNVGDRIRVPNDAGTDNSSEVLEVASITSDTVLVTVHAFQTTDATVTAGVTVIVPGAEVSQSGFKGFTIPAAFISAADDVLFWVAFGTQFSQEDPVT